MFIKAGNAFNRTLKILCTAAVHFVVNLVNLEIKYVT